MVNNAGHLYVGYTEAYTAEDIARLFDINAIGAHRVNRAALPHMRARRSGTLLYVGSTIPITTPPFLGPYVASKVAMDALAIVTMYEVGQFDIETCIVMPGAFTQGTNHFPGASHASDAAVTAAYSELDPLVARNEAATASLFPPGVEQHPGAVADEITRILTLPIGACGYQRTFAMSASPQIRGRLNIKPCGLNIVCTAVLHEKCPHMPQSVSSMADFVPSVEGKGQRVGSVRLPARRSHRR